MTKKLLKKPNPLNFFDCRQSRVPPPYFEYICIPLRYNLEASINKWINENLKGRYYLGRSINIDSANTVNSALKIGFEEPKELSYFTLACPLLKYE
jgi:hypothetical protein